MICRAWESIYHNINQIMENKISSDILFMENGSPIFCFSFTINKFPYEDD